MLEATKFDRKLATGRLQRLTSALARAPVLPRESSGVPVSVNTAAPPPRRKLRLALMGMGAIGEDVLRRCNGSHIDNGDDTLQGAIEIPAVLVRRPRATAVRGSLVTHIKEDWMEIARTCDAVLEVAGHSAVAGCAELLLSAGVDFLCTSVGAFAADPGLLDRCVAAAAEAGSRLVLPSAGIGALDILAAGAVGGLSSVKMTVRKDPSAWYGTAAENEFDLAEIQRSGKPMTVFNGTAKEGAAKYPQNVNISAAVALSGIGLEQTSLAIVADPTIFTHVIEVEAAGTFGKFHFVEDVEIERVGSHTKTGKIVGMAVVKTLRQMVSPLVVGH